jgi:hypothetical protein
VVTRPGTRHRAPEPDKPSSEDQTAGTLEYARGTPPIATITPIDRRRQVARCRELALKEPVSVTHDGDESPVAPSANAFKRLEASDMREALYAWELPK